MFSITGTVRDSYETFVLLSFPAHSGHGETIGFNRYPGLVIYTFSPDIVQMIELLALSIAPAVLIIWYIYRKDRYEPEPKYLVAMVFLLGALSTFPALLLELPFPQGIFSLAVVSPVVEEGLKFLVVYLTVYRSREFDEPMDGIVYAAATGLGFATMENMFYIFDGGLVAAVIRSAISVPGHVIFSCIWGFSLGIAKFRPKKERTRIIIAGLCGAIILHGLFNFSLAFFDIWGLVLILVVLLPLGGWILHRNIKKAHEDPASACSRLKNQTADPTPGDGPGNCTDRATVPGESQETGTLETQRR